ncbi:TonB-dependent receptor domain-containing protein [Lewinella sp. JB7]|uniref:TonB-dependent receptor n=1 Tax=Lewinella sp. JB7 TaxID=2962887 RepID=UPI0020CA0681|nr:TonB-dependent receptor [Lewinella sp. JB7]MCP9236468.1 TonB-dependent receptor [Lewinella sp. JB7]
MRTLICLLLPMFLAGQSYRLKLSVLDHVTEEPLPYVSVYLTPGGVGGLTDEEGIIILQAPRGSYDLHATYTGYAAFEQEILLRDHLEANLRLEPTTEQLQTVTVTDRADQLALTRPRMGVERLTAEALASIPTVLGERDVLKSLQLLAGVSSAGEASNGISVRGGTVDQNLLLLDGAPVFAPTHLFGLFTVFTPDAVSGVDLYRGNIPSRFGGRVASVLDVRSKVPDTERTEVRGGIGLVSSHLGIETPLDRRKRLGLLITARGGFNDFVFPLVERLKDTRSRFGDATLRLRYRAGERDFVTASGFYSQDFYQVDLLSNLGGVPATSNQYAYLTLNGGLEWLHLFNDALNLTVSVHRADYTSELRFPQTDGGKVNFLSGIDYTIGRAEGGLTLSDHEAAFGLQVDRYVLSPGTLDPGGVVGILPAQLEQETGREASLYLQDDWSISPKLSLSAGLRYTMYGRQGPGQVRYYRAGEVVRAATLTDSETFGKGKNLARYAGWEPRLGLNYRVGPRTSLKTSYARSRQYLQNIYNSTTPVPTSRWKVSDNNVVPQTADLYAVGLTHRTTDEHYLFQLETYFRELHDLLEYRPGADFFLNPAVETDLVRGKGRGYGVELTARRLTGRFTGEVNYAYARVENRVAGTAPDTRINRGQWYPGYFDQPHTLTASLVLDQGRTHELGFNFVVQSNRPYTVPNGFVSIRGTPVPLFLERNNDRLPTYHRLDFSWTIRNFRREQRRWTGSWVFTVYNVYGRDNAYNIFFQPRTPNTPALGIFQGSPFAAYRLSVFGAPILSLAYKFTFLP